MIERFAGEENKRVLLDALRGQQCVGEGEIAKAIAEVVSLQEFRKGEPVIEQDAQKNSMYFILSGSVSVLVNGREIALRYAGEHVGEMALADPSAKRSATVVAIEDGTVVAEIEEADFSRIAEAHPCLWRRLAVELAARLRERSKYVRAPNPRPVLFVGSSVESLGPARMLQNFFDQDPIIVKPWTDNVFTASNYTMNDLAREIGDCDFAVIVFGTDDEVVSRGKDQQAPRDNVVLELGLFMGALGRERTFVLTPRGAGLKIPTDLIGLKLMDYDADPTDRRAAMGPACNQLRELILKLGPR